MSHKVDIKNRAAQKQAARDYDRERLERGEITREDLRRENDFFYDVDFSKFRIVAIGGVPMEKLR